VVIAVRGSQHQRGVQDRAVRVARLNVLFDEKPEGAREDQ